MFQNGWSSTLAHFFLFLLSCHSFCPLIAFILTPSSGLLLSFLMSYTCQPSGRSTSVTKWNVPVLHPMLFPPGIDHSFLLTVHNSNPLPTHLSKLHYQDPHSSVFLPALCNCRPLSVRKNGNCRFMTHISFTLRGRYCSYNSDLWTANKKL